MNASQSGIGASGQPDPMTRSQTLINARLVGRRTTDGVSWECDFDPPWNGSEDSKKGNVSLPPESGSYKLQFHLNDPDGMGLRFVKGSGVLDVAEGGACPPPAGGTSDQIVDVTSKNGKLVSFVDRNEGKARDIAYALNLEHSGGTAQFDPVIRNGGGTNR